MKTAIHFTGHMRTFARCLPTIQYHILRHFPEPSFFVSTVKDKDAGSINALRAFHPTAPVSVDLVDAQPELPIPVPPANKEWTLGMMYGHEPYAISVHPQAILRQLWQLERAAQLFTRAGTKWADFDLHIRIRPDLWFRSFDLPAFWKRSSNSVVDGGEDLAFTPWWGRFGGINDRFALLGSQAAEAYFNTYSKVPKLLESGCPLHPESLIKASIEQAGCVVDDTMLVEFSKLYPPDHPDTKLRNSFRDPEITMVDIAHLTAKK